MGDHHRVVRSFRERTEEAEKTIEIIENRFETVFSWYTSLDQLAGTHSAAFGQFIKELFQDFCRDSIIRLNGHWHQLCCTFPKFSFALNDAQKKGFVGLRTMTDGPVDAIGVLAKGTDGFDPPSGSRALCFNATTGLSFPVVPGSFAFCAHDPLAKWARVILVFDEAALED